MKTVFKVIIAVAAATNLCNVSIANESDQTVIVDTQNSQVRSQNIVENINNHISALTQKINERTVVINKLDKQLGDLMVKDGIYAKILGASEAVGTFAAFRKLLDDQPKLKDVLLTYLDTPEGLAALESNPELTTEMKTLIKSPEYAAEQPHTAAFLKGSKVLKTYPKQNFLRSNTFNFLILGAFVGADVVTAVTFKNRQFDEISLSKKISELQGLNNTDNTAIQTLQNIMSGK